MDERLDLEAGDILPLLDAATRENMQLRVAVSALRRQVAALHAEVARYANEPDGQQLDRPTDDEAVRS